MAVFFINKILHAFHHDLKKINPL